MTKIQDTPIVASVVGAGLVGSLLAIYLSRRGYKVQVYDRRSDLRTAKIYAGRSINLALSERGWRGLQGVGIEPDVRKIGIPMYGRIMHSLDGSLSYQPYGTENQAIYSVSRGVLNLKLLELADENPNVQFFFDEKCLDVNFEKTELSLENKHTQVQTQVKSDLIFGADGAYSQVRQAMQIQPRFDFSQHYLAHGYKELNIPALPNGAFALEQNALHIWGRKNFMLIALPNLDGSFTCTLFFPFEGEVSFESLKTEAEVTTFFDTYLPDFTSLAPDCVAQFMQNPTASLVTMQCYPWKNGNTVLIGDAAHAIVPFYGQGMNSGFEDCTILDQILDTETDWQKILSQFEASRKPNADAIAALAQYNFIEMRDLTSDPQFILRKKIEAKIHKLYPEIWLPLYTMVTFSHIPYAETVRISKIQDVFMQEILAMPNIENDWDSEAFELVIHEKIKTYKP